MAYRFLRLAAVSFCLAATAIPAQARTNIDLPYDSALVWQRKPAPAVVTGAEHSAGSIAWRVATRRLVPAQGGGIVGGPDISRSLGLVALATLLAATLLAWEGRQRRARDPKTVDLRLTARAPGRRRQGHI